MEKIINAEEVMVETMEEETVEKVEVENSEEKAKKLTLREFYEAIIAGAEITEEMKQIAEKKLEQIDKKNEYARNHKKSGNSKKAKENAEVKAKIAELMADGAARKAKEIAETLDLTQQKVSALARQMVEDGVLVADEQKVKGGRLVKVYTKVAE